MTQNLREFVGEVKPFGKTSPNYFELLEPTVSEWLDSVVK